MDLFNLVILGFVLDLFAFVLILIFGINLIVVAQKKDNPIQKEFTQGLGGFFISVAASALIYGIDLAHRTFYGSRLFPDKPEYVARGLEFESFHPQAYFIVILIFLLLSLALLMKPIELYLMQRKKPIVYKLCLGLAPLPLVIRILELQILPQENSAAYYVFTGLYLVIWLVIAYSIISLVSLYLKAALKSAGDVKKRSWAIVISIFVWLLTTFLRQNLLKTLEESPFIFWVAPLIEVLMLILFIYGFAQTMEFELSSEENVYLYQNWFFNVIAWGTLIMVSIYLSIIFWGSDLDLVIYWKNAALTNESLDAFGTFIDQSALEGDGLGGQDFSYFLLIPFVLLYFPSFLPQFEEKLKKVRIYGGLMIANAAVLAIVNRWFKAFFSRARPGAAMEDSSLYSRMWTMGKWPLEEGFSSGSFTSGHTTTGAILIVLAFIAIRTHKTWFISLVFATTITWTGLMGFGRVVHGAHYPSDTLWATTIAIMLTAWVYFKVLKIPEQERGEYEIAKKWGELRWTILFVFFSLFILVTLLGIKYSIMEFAWYWPIAAVAGLPISYLFWKRMKFILQPKGSIPATEA